MSAKNSDTSAKNNDTIVATATPPGRGGVAILRASGPHVCDLIQRCLQKKFDSFIPRKAILTAFLDRQKEILDHGIAIYFKAPHSFTGEDVLEFHGHAGAILNDLLLKEMIHAGARLAEPGEFSLRAFLNNKIDLTQAEAIADLIDASSELAARSAMRSLKGDFSKAIHSLVARIIHLRCFIEAAIDFSDEDIPFLKHNEIAQQLQGLTNDLQTIQEKAQQGSLLREGIKLVIVGKPNVGKSSLLNRLSGKELAIVTDIPGTTRDVIRDDIVMDGIALHVMDTAGLRESSDVVEAEGIQRAKQAMLSADIILYVSDVADDHALKQELLHDNVGLQELHRDKRLLCVRNKIDLRAEIPHATTDSIAISVKEGSGIDLLKQAIKHKMGVLPNAGAGAGAGADAGAGANAVTGAHANYMEAYSGVFLARRRHLKALAQTAEHVATAECQFQSGALDLLAEELRLAQQQLNTITGEFSADDLLGHIFASFCIGK